MKKCVNWIIYRDAMMCSILEGFAYLRFLHGFPTAEYTPSEFRKNKGRLSFLLHLYFVHQTLLIPLNIRLRPPRMTPKAQTITSNQQSTSSVGFRQDDRDHNIKSTSSVGFRQDDRDWKQSTCRKNCRDLYPINLAFDERRNGTSFFLHERGRALEVCGKI